MCMMDGNNLIQQWELEMMPVNKEVSNEFMLSEMSLTCYRGCPSLHNVQYQFNKKKELSVSRTVEIKAFRI